MLVHKRTMGVLDLYWTGRNRTGPDGAAEPVMGEYTMEDLRGAAGGGCEDDWWEVPRGCALGKKLRRMYPYCTAVVGEDGSMIDVAPMEEAQPKAPEKQKSEKKRRQRRRKTGLLEVIFEKQ